jgi:hypothetical protein
VDNTVSYYQDMINTDMINTDIGPDHRARSETFKLNSYIESPYV